MHKFVATFENIRPELQEEFINCCLTIVYEFRHLYRMTTEQEREVLGEAMEDFGLFLAEKGVKAWMEGDKFVEIVPTMLTKLESQFIRRIATTIIEAVKEPNVIETEVSNG